MDASCLLSGLKASEAIKSQYARAARRPVPSPHPTAESCGPSRPRQTSGHRDRRPPGRQSWCSQHAQLGSAPPPAPARDTRRPGGQSSGNRRTVRTESNLEQREGRRPRKTAIGSSPGAWPMHRIVIATGCQPAAVKARVTAKTTPLWPPDLESFGPCPHSTGGGSRLPHKKRRVRPSGLNTASWTRNEWP